MQKEYFKNTKAYGLNEMLNGYKNLTQLGFYPSVSYVIVEDNYEEFDKLLSFIEKNNLDKNQKFILYAPTFRDDRNLDKYDIDFDVIINELQKITKQKWKVLLKLHPNVSDKSKKIFNNENIIDVSNGYELNSVMITSDLLITDYSSLMFDYSYLLKPIILYATDIDQMNKDRGFLFDLYELPFPISKTNIELLKIIKEFDYEIFEKNIKEFNKRLNINETGKASQYVAKIIKKEIDKKE